MNDVEWLTIERVLIIHQEIVEASGGSHGLRDEGLLESALARPQNLYAYHEVSIFELAASYAEGVVHNHPFIDGNKRSGLAIAGLFLDANGYHLKADQSELADIMVDLAEKKITRDGLADFLRANSRRLK